jgi:hypothetical protein
MSYATAGVVVVFDFCFAVSNIFLPANMSNNTTGPIKEMYNGIKYPKGTPFPLSFRMIALNPISKVIDVPIESVATTLAAPLNFRLLFAPISIMEPIAAVPATMIIDAIVPVWSVNIS